MPNCHTRQYVERPDNTSTDPKTPATVLLGDQTDFEYDSVTQLEFDNVEAFQAYYAATKVDEKAAAAINEDEEAFADVPSGKAVVLGDCLSTKRS